MRQAPVSATAVPQLIEEATQLSSFEPRLPTSFSFVWDKKRFAAKVEDRKGRAMVSLVGDILAVPFTAEDPAARRRVGTLVAAATRGKANAATFRIGRNQHLQMSLEREIERPITGAAIVTGVALALLGARPLIILAEELGAKDQAKRVTFRRPAKTRARAKSR